MNRSRGTKLQSQSFDYALLAAINELLTDIFSEKSVKNIYSTMERVYSLKREDIPDNIQLFESSLESIIGSGHTIIEDLLLEKMYSANGLDYEYKKGYELEDYISELKKIANDA